MIQKFINWLNVTFSQIKYHAWKFVSDFMIYVVDERINHNYLEPLVDNDYELWYNTSYKLCVWICDTFETFGEKQT